LKDQAQGPEENYLSLEHQNQSKTSEKMGYFDRFIVSLHILYTANQETEGWQGRLTVHNSALCASVSLRTTAFGRPSGDVLCASKDMAAFLDFQNGEQQSRCVSDKKRRSRLQ